MSILVIRWLVVSISTLLVAMTVLPFVRTDAWWIRVLDFPRAQLAVLLLSLVGCSILLVSRRAGVADLLHHSLYAAHQSCD